MTGISRLSRRFSKKSHGPDDSASLTLSLPANNLQATNSLPPNIELSSKPKIKPKPKITSRPKYIKRESLKADAQVAVANIVREYGSTEALHEPITAADNLAYMNTEVYTNKRSSTVEVNGEENGCGIVRFHSEQPHQTDDAIQHHDDVTVTFNNADADSGFRDADTAQLTPMRFHPPILSSGDSSALSYSYKGSIHIEDDNETL